tara:strand:- start:907 stop:1266 length:360 start_codon:yes stop_codon:yes gene_type:complete
LIHSQQNGSKENPYPIKAVVLDSIKSNAIANIIVEGQKAKEELDQCAKTKKTQGLYIRKLEKNASTSKKALSVSDSIIAKQVKIISNDGVIQKRQQRKITFWQWVSAGLAGVLIWIAAK